MVKVGDRVKVEFEGVVTDTHLDTVLSGIEVNARWYSPGEVTVLPPEEPKGLGAVVRVTYRSVGAGTQTYTVVRTTDPNQPWSSPENGYETWEDLHDSDATIEILSEGYHVPE